MAGTGKARAVYAVIVLMIAYGASLIDRQILTLMVGDVRADLGLTDTQLSLLHGLAFALFYTGFGVPLGWIADRFNRRALISVGLLVWGVATVSCGLVSSFAGLFAARMAVGMGEAALSPAAYSMIHDLFEPRTRGRAMSVYGMGVFLGAGAAYIVGGATVQYGAAGAAMAGTYGLHLRPWQFVFVLAGGISLVVLALVATLREPARRADPQGITASGRAGPLDSIAHVWRHKSLHGAAILGLSIGSIVFNGVFAWVPSHFSRVFQWPVARIGAAFGLVLLIAGTAGMASGGAWADKVARAGRGDGAIRVVFWGEALGGVAAMVFGFMPTPAGALAVLCVCVFCYGAAIALGPVALQDITPSNIRSQMIAFYLFVVNVLGLGLGPTLIASISDHLLHDERSIGKAVSIAAMLVVPFSAAFLLVARRNFARLGPPT